jgi:hypothetical protein
MLLCQHDSSACLQLHTLRVVPSIHLRAVLTVHYTRLAILCLENVGTGMRACD